MYQLSTVYCSVLLIAAILKYCPRRDETDRNAYYFIASIDALLSGGLDVNDLSGISYLFLSCRPLHLIQ